MAAQITLAQLHLQDGGSNLNDMEGNLDTISNLKTIRVIRLFKLVRLLRVEALLGHLEFSLPLLSAVVGLLRLLLMISILSHLTACVWYYMATRNIYNSWVSKYHLGCCSPNQVPLPYLALSPALGLQLSWVWPQDTTSCTFSSASPLWLPLAPNAVGLDCIL